MPQSLRLAGSDPQPGARHAGNPGYGAESSDTDWELARLPAPNVLFVGTEQTVSNVVRSLWSDFEEPIMVRRRDERLRLPPSSEPAGTMIVHDVDTLTDADQRALEDWLIVRKGRTRVVSTAAASLLPMVEAGAFSDVLYYRLNTVCIDLRSPR